MAEAGFCVDCAQWRYEFNTAFQTQDEQDGFGICDRVEAMKENPIRALARIDDEFAHFQTRREFGCVLFVPR